MAHRASFAMPNGCDLPIGEALLVTEHNFGMSKVCLGVADS